MATFLKPASLKDDNKASEKIAAPVMNGYAYSVGEDFVLSDNGTLEVSEGSKLFEHLTGGALVLVIPPNSDGDSFHTLAFKRALEHPEGFTDDKGKNTKYAFGTMINPDSKLNGFYLGVSKR